MLPEKALKKYSALAIFVGLCGLYMVGAHLEPKKISLAEIDQTFTGDYVKTQGTIEVVYLSNSSTLFLTITENKSTLKVVKFDEEQTEFKKGDLVLVEGEISSYQGELELIADLIEEVNSQ